MIGSSRVRPNVKNSISGEFDGCKPCGYRTGFRFRIARAAHQIAKFNIKSMVLSIAEEAMDNDFDIMAEKIFPRTRIYERNLRKADFERS